MIASSHANCSRHNRPTKQDSTIRFPLKKGSDIGRKGLKDVCESVFLAMKNDHSEGLVCVFTSGHDRYHCNEGCCYGPSDSIRCEALRVLRILRRFTSLHKCISVPQVFFAPHFVSGQLATAAVEIRHSCRR